MSFYTLGKALESCLNLDHAKFDESVDVDVNFRVNAKVNQSVKGVFFLPHAVGSKKKIACLATGNTANMALEMGLKADVDAILDEIKNKKMDFDALIATPEFMPKLVPFAPILGPKGMMPNVKFGTVIEGNVQDTVKNFLSRFLYTLNKKGIVRGSIGRVSFTPEVLEENAIAVLSELKKAFPSNFGCFIIKKLFLSSTMGKSFMIDTRSVL